MSDKTLVDQWIAKAKNHPWIAALCVFGIVVVGIATFTDAVGRLWGLLPKGNPYSVSVHHEQEQSGRIAQLMGSAVVTSKWTAIISNNGEDTDSILRFHVTAHYADEEIEYSGFYADLVGNIYDAEGRHIKLPISLEPGHSTRINIELSVIMTPTAYQLLNNAYPDNQIPSLQDANKLVAYAIGTDMFGQKAEPMGVDENTPLGFGVAVFSDHRNPRLSIEFQTSRSIRIRAESDWYQGERRKKLRPGERPRSLNN